MCDQATQELLSIEVGILLTRCSPLEQEILERRFGFVGEPQTRTGIADDLDIDVSEVLSNEKQALRRLVPYARKIKVIFEEEWCETNTITW